MILDSILKRFSNDLAIDLGTANTLVYSKGRGDSVQRTIGGSRTGYSWTKIKTHCGWPAGQGDGRKNSGSIRAIRPLRDGVIADFDAAPEND